jgi:hypothetical protein
VHRKAHDESRQADSRNSGRDFLISLARDGQREQQKREQKPKVVLSSPAACLLLVWKFSV